MTNSRQVVPQWLDDGGTVAVVMGNMPESDDTATDRSNASDDPWARDSGYSNEPPF